MTHTPKTLDLSALPKHLADNWNILLCLRSDAQVKFAMLCSPTPSNNSKEWCECFDAAANQWLAANPMDPMWATGKWPTDAANFLGKDALTEARLIVAQTDSCKA